jgi:hypothetical protein
VQALFGEKVYKTHELLYASGLMTCGHCGNLITGERVNKPSGKSYVYYRCTMYNTQGHPRTRLPEHRIDEQFLSLFQSIRQPDEVRDWFARMLRLWSQKQQQNARVETGDLQLELTQLRGQQDRLLNLRLLEEIDGDMFSLKSTELRDRIAGVTLKLESADRSRAEQADTAIRTFELSQSLEEKWLTADYAEKRHLLQILLLNCKLDGVTLAPTMNKPFDLLAKGLVVPSNRGDKI